MKRFLALLLCLAMSAALLAGCGEAASSDSGGATSTPDATPQPIEVYNYNPLTGAAKDPNVPDGLRPVAIMLDNLRESLPHTGLSSADVVYEMVTEGGITRLLAVFTDYRMLPLVGPVRSARDQHVQFMLPMNAIFVHIGGSTYANDLLNYYKYQDVDGFYLGTNAFVFDETRYLTKSREHCWYTNAALVQQGIDKVATIPTTGTLKPLFTFSSGSRVTPAGGAASSLSFRFSNYADAAFSYDAASGTYLQSQFGIPHTDAGTGTQLGFTNLFLLATDISLKKDGVVSEFNFTGGDGWYFSNGAYTAIKWSKGAPDAPLKVQTLDGSELSVNAGKSYIAVVGNDQRASIAVDGVAIAS